MQEIYIKYDNIVRNVNNYSKGDTYPDPNLVAMLKKLG